MGFPAGDMSSGFFGYVEVSMQLVLYIWLHLSCSTILPALSLPKYLTQGFYRNHMEEVIKFFETHHKVIIYLCSWSIYIFFILWLAIWFWLLLYCYIFYLEGNCLHPLFICSVSEWNVMKLLPLLVEMWFWLQFYLVLIIMYFTYWNIWSQSRKRTKKERIISYLGICAGQVQSIQPLFRKALWCIAIWRKG